MFITPMYPAKGEVKIVMGPVMHSISECLAERWNGVDPIYVEAYDLYVTPYISQKSTEDGVSQIQKCCNLYREWYDSHRDMAGRHVFLTVSGDDNLMSVRAGGKTVLITADGNRWDAHIRAPALDYETAIFRNFLESSGFDGTEITEEIAVGEGVIDPQTYTDTEEVLRLIAEAR